jgi:hypothetical protein
MYRHDDVGRLGCNSVDLSVDSSLSDENTVISPENTEN